MDLSLFLSPVAEHLGEDIKHPGKFYKNIKVYKERLPEYKDADIALIGVQEDRGAPDNQGTAQGPTAIREKLYHLMKGSGAYKIVDLGNIAETYDVEETYGRLQEVCRTLMENDVLPVIIGGSQDLDYGQYLAYDDLEKLVSWVNIDARLDMEEDRDNPAMRHVHRIFMHQPNFLFHYIHLAYQSYLIDPEAVAVLEKLYFEAHRVGVVRGDIKEMEPVIRQADLMSFDVSAIRASDAPGSAHTQPFGLTGEEACQLCWYGGLNEKLTSVGFYEYNPELDNERSDTAAIVATMIWYFIEGFYHRKDSADFKGSDYTRYTVSMKSDPEELVFYKSKISEKWWMEVPLPQEKNRYQRNCIIPCSYNDYLQAQMGDLPDRWIQAQARFF